MWFPRFSMDAQRDLFLGWGCIFYLLCECESHRPTSTSKDLTVSYPTRSPLPVSILASLVSRTVTMLPFDPAFHVDHGRILRSAYPSSTSPDGARSDNATGQSFSQSRWENTHLIFPTGLESGSKAVAFVCA